MALDESRKIRKNAKDANAKKGKHKLANAVSEPSLDDELKRFKAIVRHTMKHEAERKNTRWFLNDYRPQLRRLAKLGVAGHQPAFAAYCKVSEEERQATIEAILGQKVGANPKATKAYKNFIATSTETSNTTQKMLIKIARIATGATIRWKRNSAPTEGKTKKAQHNMGEM